MSGICAVWHKDDPKAAGRSLTGMLAGLSISGLERPAKELDTGIGLAVSARFPGQQIYRNDAVIVACDADLCGEAELWRYLGRPPEAERPARTAMLMAGLYERLGPEFVQKLRGAFAVIVWDCRKRRLHAAIDGFGIDRLVYYEDSKLLLVASRIDALLGAGHIDVKVNPRAVVNLLNFTTSLAPETFVSGVSRLAPGAALRASAGHTEVKPYWDMRYGVDANAGEKQLGRELESLVQRAVADHCNGDPSASLGAFLSGGTDSSTVVGMMARNGQNPVHAYSIGFQEDRFNELRYAVITAQTFGARHHTYLVGPDDCFNALPRMVRSFDEPFANSSAIPTYFCAGLAAETGVKVLLAGDGGDELFGGNERYVTDRVFGLYQRAPAVLRKRLVEPALALLPGAWRIVEKGRKYVKRSSLPPLERFFSYHFLRANAPAEVFEQDFLDAIGGYDVLDIPWRHYRNAPAVDHLDRLLYVDVKITLGDSDLPKVTSMCELAGIRPRFPFLDRAVAEFSGRIPAALKVKGVQSRYLFKRAFRKLLPPEVIAKQKHGFGLPVGGWLRSDRRLRELARDTLFSRRALERCYFRRRFMEDLFHKHETDESTYYGYHIWSFLVLELWHRQMVDELVKAPA